MASEKQKEAVAKALEILTPEFDDVEIKCLKLGDSINGFAGSTSNWKSKAMLDHLAAIKSK